MGGSVNCKAKIQTGMPLSEVFIQKRVKNVQKYPTMNECAAAPGRGQGFLQGTRRQDHGARGCGIAVGGLSTVCPCACFCTHCLAGGMHAFISSAGSASAVGCYPQLSVFEFWWIWELHDFLRVACERKPTISRVAMC